MELKLDVSESSWYNEVSISTNNVVGLENNDSMKNVDSHKTHTTPRSELANSVKWESPINIQLLHKKVYLLCMLCLYEINQFYPKLKLFFPFFYEKEPVAILQKKSNLAECFFFGI